MLRADGARIWNTVQQIKFLNRDGVDLVERVDDRDVATTLRFDDINQIIHSGVAPNGHICVRHTILVQHRLDLIVVDMREWNSRSDVDATLVLFLENNVRWALVDTDAETFQFVLDDTLVGKGLIDI
jgi:hypothetical protein